MANKAHSFNEIDEVIYETGFVFACENTGYFEEMSITIKQIAKDLQLAISTVSKALRDSHEISAATKARVFAYVSEVDYTPNPYASSLKGRRSGNIAVVLPEVADSFFSEAINGIEKVAQEKGYHVMVYLTHDDAKKEQAIVRDFRNGRVDGALISIASDSQDHRHLFDLSSRNIPVVFFDRICAEVDTASVVTNDYQCGYDATQYLISKGCKNIAFLSLFDDLQIIKNRREGFRRAVLESTLDAQKDMILYLTNDETKNKEKISELLSAKNRPDGIIGSVEKVTTQAYDVCNNLAISIPNDIKIIGFSHLQIAHLLNPSLTTITQPAFEMGKTASTLLFKSLEKKNTAIAREQIVIPSVLIPRGSTG
ncbi:MAG TPA: LacI family DNA-binding transcriptional regulator [Chryseolinea sp.]|nr:LacI family DNA-binding transcriptional regulator [Chryseolinea sp.]